MTNDFKSFLAWWVFGLQIFYSILLAYIFFMFARFVRNTRLSLIDVDKNVKNEISSVVLRIGIYTGIMLFANILQVVTSLLTGFKITSNSYYIAFSLFSFHISGIITFIIYLYNFQVREVIEYIFDVRSKKQSDISSIDFNLNPESNY